MINRANIKNRKNLEKANRWHIYSALIAKIDLQGAINPNNRLDFFFIVDFDFSKRLHALNINEGIGSFSAL